MFSITIKKYTSHTVRLLGLAALEEALEASEKRDKKSQNKIANLGKRLNAALASLVQELARYRSEFFGRLREVLGNHSGIRIVGDRFVFQSEVLFECWLGGNLGPEGLAGLDGLAASLRDLFSGFPNDIDWVLRVDGHTDSRPITSARFPSNWELSTARAISVVNYPIRARRSAAAPRRRRFWRIPAARHRRKRRGLRAQPAYRAEARRSVRLCWCATCIDVIAGRVLPCPAVAICVRVTSARKPDGHGRDKPGHDGTFPITASFHLRPDRAEDEDAAIEPRLTWQLAYPSIDFAARVAWGGNAARRNGAERRHDRRRAGERHRRAASPSMQTAIRPAAVSPDHRGSPLATALLAEARRLRPAASRCWSEGTTPRHRFDERNGFARTTEDVDTRRAGRCQKWLTG